MDKKASKAIKLTLSFAAAAVLVYFAFRGVHWGDFWDGVRQTRWGYVVLFFVASLGALYFRMLRWRAILRPLNPSVRRLAVWDADNVGNLANVVLPGSGEIVRCGYVTGPASGFDKIFGTVVLERLWDILAIVLLFVLALGFGADRFWDFFSGSIWAPLRSKLDFSLWPIVAGGVVIACALVWTAFRFRERSRICAKLSGALGGVWDGFVSFTRMERKPLFAVYTVLIWLMYILMCWSIQKSMPALDSLDFMDAVFISAVGNIASIVPVPGGVGAYHYLVSLTVSSIYGLSWDTGILFATLNHELHAVLVIVLGVISWISLAILPRGTRREGLPPLCR